MAALETIGPLMNGMKMRADMAGLACEALNRMFQREQTELVAQVTQYLSQEGTESIIIIFLYKIPKYLFQMFVNSFSCVCAGSPSRPSAIPFKTVRGSRVGDS